MTKQQPSIVIEKLGTHLMSITNNHSGEVKLKWDWDVLLQEVVDATTKSRDLVAETETKVKRTRKKKTT